MNRILHTHLRLARVSNLPTTWSNVLCAFLLVGVFEWARFLAAIFAISLLYIAGMYLNDWRDADHDSRHQPERPIPSGLISRPAVLFYALAYGLVALLVSLSMEADATLWTLALIGCIAFYDLDHKNNVFSPWIMAACRALIYPWAAALAGAELSAALWIASLAAYSYTLGLTYIARGVMPLPYKLIFCWCLLLPVGLWLPRMGVEPRLVGLTVLTGFLLWMAYCLSGIFRTSPRIGFTVGKLIAGFCLVDLLAVSVMVSSASSSTSSSAYTGIAAFILLFIGTIRFQTHISGT